MNIQQKITELEEHARFLQTQAHCLQMMQNMSSSQDKRPQEGSMIPYGSQQMMQMQPYHPIQPYGMPHQQMQTQPYAPQHMQMQPYQHIQPQAQAYAMPSQQMQTQPYAHQHKQMQLYAPPHALNNQESIIKTTTIRRAKLPAMQVVMQLVMQQQSTSLPLREKVVQFIDTNMLQFLAKDVGRNEDFFCVCDEKGKKPLSSYEAPHKKGGMHQDMIDRIVQYITEEYKKHGMIVF